MRWPSDDMVVLIRAFARIERQQGFITMVPLQSIWLPTHLLLSSFQTIYHLSKQRR